MVSLITELLIVTDYSTPQQLVSNQHFAILLEKIDKMPNDLNGRKVLIAGDFNLDYSKRIPRLYFKCIYSKCLYIKFTPT